MKSTKQNNITLHPQELTPPKDYPSFDSPDTKALKIKCFIYWKKHRFPNCCDFHKQRVLNENLNVTAWDNSGEHLFKAITYTLFFVNNATKDEEGLDHIKKYITSILFSFGNHSPILDEYIQQTVAILKNKISNTDSQFLKIVIEYLETPNESKDGIFKDLAEAEQAFHKWLDSLPKDLIPEEVQQNLSLIFFHGIIKSLIDDHEISGVRRLELNSVDQFLEYLSETTTLILNEIWQSITQGDINETIKKASIIDRHKTSTEINLAFKNYSDKERNYLTIIHNWGKMVSGFIDREIKRKQLLADSQTREPLAIVNRTEKLNPPSKPSFPELFRDISYYHRFIEILTRSKLIDENRVWIGEDKNKMIAIFWGLLSVKNSDRSIFVSGPPKPTPYARKIYEHFKIDPTALCPERYLRDYQKHIKVTTKLKDKCTKELEVAMF